ncbi:hypothetical protein BPAE_0118g00210 [Botrytis paeoniae]|uniref:Uncharacterized protein n=1 Tax=Botrytis paeoniae TaxID=278948 RepID=A0A4Z1FGA3_9HELO|nr:hypothetical protein BPAE_0118g00210 [Botrytis paeoniae]
MRPNETDGESAFILNAELFIDDPAEDKRYGNIMLPPDFSSYITPLSSHMQATVRLALSFQPRMRPDSVDYGQGETCQSGSSAEEQETSPLPDMRGYRS